MVQMPKLKHLYLQKETTPKRSHLMENIRDNGQDAKTQAPSWLTTCYEIALYYYYHYCYYYYYYYCYYNTFDLILLLSV